MLSGFPAFPCLSGETEDFHLDPASLESAGHPVGADGGHGDGPPPHGTGIIEEEGDHGIAKISFLFHLVGKGVEGIDHDSRKTGGIKQPVVEIQNRPDYCQVRRGALR